MVWLHDHALSYRELSSTYACICTVCLTPSNSPALRHSSLILCTRARGIIVAILDHAIIYISIAIASRIASAIQMHLYRYLDVYILKIIAVAVTRLEHGDTYERVHTA